MENKSRYSVAVVLLCFSLSACSTLHEAVFGRENKLAPLANASLGNTTRDDIMKQFGAPEEIDRRWFESFSAEVFFYREQYNGNSNQVQQRFLGCEFSNGVLTAYTFRDSDESVSMLRNFEDQSWLKLTKGKSTRQDVENLLGVARGKALLPTTITLPALDTKLGLAVFPITKIPEASTEAWQYYSQYFDEVSNKSSQKTLTLFFDAKGVYIASFLMQEQVVKSH